MTEQTGEQLATIPTEDAGAAPTEFGLGDLDVVRIYNSELEAYGESPRAGVQFLAGWEIVDPTPEEAAAATSYDPSLYNVGEVLGKLNDPATSTGERDAILALEGDGKQRKTILEWEPEGSDDEES